jgi:hypothetical protein
MAEKQDESHETTEDKLTDLENELLTFLRSISLEEFHESFVVQGITKTSHLVDVEEYDAQMNFKMTKFPAKRLTREFSAWKERKSKQQISQTFKNVTEPEYNVSKSSVVIPLRPGFKTFFQTRDGQGNIVVQLIGSKTSSKICGTRTH